MYCGSVYGKITLKLKSMPKKTIISDANKICLQNDQIENRSLRAAYVDNINNFKVVSG